MQSKKQWMHNAMTQSRVLLGARLVQKNRSLAQRVHDQPGYSLRTHGVRASQGCKWLVREMRLKAMLYPRSGGARLTLKTSNATDQMRLYRFTAASMVPTCTATASTPHQPVRAISVT